MTGTQTALLVALIGFVGAAVVAPIVNGRIQRRNQRRAAHEPAVAAARLIRREIEQHDADANAALSSGRDYDVFATQAWDEHKSAAAGRLTPEELLVLDRYYAVVRTGAVPMVAALNSMAVQAIAWLATGEINVTKPRRTETSLAPVNMDLPCRCGHIFGHHGWRAVRRRVRFRHRHAKFKDVGFECQRCECRRFRGMGPLRYM